MRVAAVAGFQPAPARAPQTRSREGGGGGSLRGDEGAIIMLRNRVLIDDPAGGPRYAFSILEITAPEGAHA